MSGLTQLNRTCDTRVFVSVGNIMPKPSCHEFDSQGWAMKEKSYHLPTAAGVTAIDLYQQWIILMDTHTHGRTRACASIIVYLYTKRIINGRQLWNVLQTIANGCIRQCWLNFCNIARCYAKLNNNLKDDDRLLEVCNDHFGNLESC